MRSVVGTALSLFALVSLTACDGPPRDFVEFNLPEEAPFGERGDPPILTLEVEPLRLEVLDQDVGEPLPHFELGPLVAVNDPLNLVMELITLDTDIAYTIDEDAAELTLTLRAPQGRSLSETLESISRATGVHYVYEDNLLEISAERDYILTLPRQADSLGTLSGIIGSLGANNVDSDDTSGIVTFSADRRVARRVREYLYEYWQSRDVIVYDIYFLEVLLSANRDVGINWDELSVSIGPSFDISAGFTSGQASEGLTITSSGSIGGFTISSIFAFLETQGEVRSLANPQISLLNGGEATFEVEETQQFISSVEREEDEEDGDVTLSVDTDEESTGFNLSLTGTYSNGVVYSEIQLEVNELLGFTEFSTGDDNGDSTTLSLPNTTDRSIDTSATVRPGDVVVLGGLIQEDDDASRSDLPGTGFPLRLRDTTTRTELVILLSPRILQYRPSDALFRSDVSLP